MSKFVEVKTAELTGPALDWAVANVLGYECGRLPVKYRALGCNTTDGLQYVIGQLYGASMVEEIKARFFRPSTDWSQGGPLRDKYDVGIEPGAPDGLPYAYVPGRDLEGSFGETALIALCRAIVAAKLGDVVQVPVELGGGAA